MAVSLTQPLLNGAGTAYNTSVVLLADINSNIARDQLSRDMQSLLLDLHKAYWDLYLQRVAVAQRVRLLQAGMSIRDNLVARRNVDVLRGQIARAQSAVANRRADLIRRQAAVKNAEARIRAIVNDPGLGVTETVELVPDRRAWPPQGANESVGQFGSSPEFTPRDSTRHKRNSRGQRES